MKHPRFDKSRRAELLEQIGLFAYLLLAAFLSGLAYPFVSLIFHGRR